MGSKLRFEKDGRIARLTLNRPRKQNSFDEELLESFLNYLKEIEDDEDIKLVTIRGSKGVFSTGADLELALKYIKNGNREGIKQFINRVHAVTNGIADLPMPTLAVVEGYALAGGLEIMVACDLIVADETAKIGDQHANYGLVAGGGATQRLPRQIPVRLAKELMYTGKWILGEEAADIGLVNRSVPEEDIDRTVEELEVSITEKGRKSIMKIKSLVDRGLRTNIDAGLDLERQSVVDHYFSDEAYEGYRAFNENREPEFE